MISQFFRGAWRRVVAWLRPAPQRYAIAYVEGDELPSAIPKLTLAVAREDGELWAAGMICPCGCERKIELVLLPGVKPRWDVYVGKAGRPTLQPSVWIKDGCRSHFWLRDGEIWWCRD